MTTAPVETVDSIWAQLQSKRESKTALMALWRNSPKAPAGGADDERYRSWCRSEDAFLARAEELDAEIRALALRRNALLLGKYG